MMIERLKKLLKLNKKSKLKSVEEEIDEMFDSLGVDELRIVIGEDLVCFGENLSHRVRELRRKIKDKTGLIIPPVRILDSSTLQENEYQVVIRERTVFTGYTVPKEDYAINEITSSLEKTCIEHADIVLSNEITEKYMETVQRKNGWLICYVSRLIPTTGIKVILSDLIKNGKSINDITFIFEKICELATKDRDMCSIRDPYKIARDLNGELNLR